MNDMMDQNFVGPWTKIDVTMVAPSKQQDVFEFLGDAQGTQTRDAELELLT